MFISDVLSKRTLTPTLPLMATSLCPPEPPELGTYLGSAITSAFALLNLLNEDFSKSSCELPCRLGISLGLF